MNHQSKETAVDDITVEYMRRAFALILMDYETKNEKLFITRRVLDDAARHEVAVSAATGPNGQVGLVFEVVENGGPTPVKTSVFRKQ